MYQCKHRWWFVSQLSCIILCDWWRVKFVFSQCGWQEYEQFRSSMCKHSIPNMTYLDEAVVHETTAKKQNALRSLRVISEECFSCFSDLIYQHMKRLDPKNWEDDVTYASNQIEKLASHFKDPLEKDNFDCRVVHKESRQLKNFARSHWSGLDAHSFWEKIFIYRRNEFKNVFLMDKINFSLSTLNSMAERAFRYLTLLLSDKRLSLKHKTTKSLMEINLSDQIWTEKEKNEILERAVDVYLSKQQGNKITELPTKVCHMKLDNENNQERLLEPYEEDKVVLLTDPTPGSWQWGRTLTALFHILYYVNFKLFFGLFTTSDFVLASFVFNVFFTFWRTERKNIDISHFSLSCSKIEWLNYLKKITKSIKILIKCIHVSTEKVGGLSQIFSCYC